jgi:two-component system chemotaxis response regulator CheY
MYSDKLAREGFEVVSAVDGASGIEAARKNSPDVILLDIIMPKVNGLDVLKILKESPDTRETPIYLLTNLPEDCSGQKAQELGASGYLVKAEYEPQTVVDLLRGVSIRNKKKEEAAKGK